MPGIPRHLKLLEKQLSGLPDESEPMLISELDGFLAGILVCPDLIMPREWLPMVWGGGDEDAAPVFENTRQVEKLVNLVMEHYNATADDLHRGRYAPVFEVDARHDEILWELWIGGFETALQLCPDSWAAITDGDENSQVALAGLLTLLEISRGDSTLSKTEINDLTDKAPDLIAHWVETLNAWRIGKHRAGLPEAPAPQFGAKVGRNDPCPCGSGKKYKKCCGLN
jgi:uncharacterized protein